MNNRTYIARSLDESILEKGENGGAVTSILKFALETGKVDGVVAVRAEKGSRYGGIPVLITNPEELIDTAGSLHCSTANISRFVKEHLDGASTMKLAVVGKPCDIRAIIELHKREQVNLDNLILIGLNCSGVIAPAIAKKMFIEEFDVDPDEVIREDIDDGELIIVLRDGTRKAMDLKKLEEKGYGRRENCRRCEIKIPVFADLACGKWGAEEKKGTFIEVCSDKGSVLISEAIEKCFIEVEEPTKENIKLREKKNEAEVERAMYWRERDLKPILEMSQSERLEFWMADFNKCIKCYGCRDVCPICYCDNCILEANREIVERGSIPPDTLFPLTRLSHVADSCVNCGHCQDVCPMELPLSILYTLLQSRLGEVFDYTPGVDVEQDPPLMAVTDQELQIEDTFLDVTSKDFKRGSQ